MKKLFLCHHSAHAASVLDLATELRLRGIVPWVAENGGFMLGDDQEHEARRVIRQDCQGLLFYATPGAIERDFVRRVELDEACRRVRRERVRRVLRLGPRTPFIITTVTDGVSWDQVRAASLTLLRHDLSRYAGAAIGFGDPPATRTLVAQHALRVRLRNVPRTNEVSLQVSTRAPMPDLDEDLLRIDAEDTLVGNPVPAWTRVGRGLEDVKDEIAWAFGRPMLRVHGSRHLSGSFLLGATFRRSSGFNLLVRARDGDWATSGPLEAVQIDERLVRGEAAGLAIEIAATDKDPTPAVDRYLAMRGLRPRVMRLRVENARVLSAGQGRFIAAHVRRRIVELIPEADPRGLLLFMSVPQALAVQLGHEWNALPVTTVHEFGGTTYEASVVWPTASLTHADLFTQRTELRKSSVVVAGSTPR
ncbi:MAG TPA: SAVED domain-containing protein [Candidatus Limnocylindria bacterium]|jgi:hypothetical protein|nr:SAVED domain-containing protein [Candidatus Limnocylindria bacterium]